MSRSSGAAFRASRAALWAMAAAQFGLLAFFAAAAVGGRAFFFPYSWALLGPAFGAGLLGDACYVGAFSLVAAEVAPARREAALAAASIADAAGIALVAGAGVVIQGCLFRAIGLPGADFKCGGGGA